MTLLILTSTLIILVLITVTSIKFKKVGDKVNVETDVLAKYIEKLVGKNGVNDNINITENWLKELGY